MNFHLIYSKISSFFPAYLLILAIFLVLYAMLEFIVPLRIVRWWNSFVQSKLFPLYGLMLILGGFPLTQFYRKLSGKFLFVPGIFIVLSGPFILLFPDSFRSAMSRTSFEAPDDEIKQMAYVDAILRMIVVTLILLVLYV